MEPEVIKEAIKRIRGLPTLSRIRKELTENFSLHITEEELEEDLEGMINDGKIAERTTTIKGNEFKGYKIVQKEGEEKKKEEEKSEEERIIDEIFG